MKFIFVSCIILFAISSNCLSQSSFYSSSGKLLIDTAYSISKEAFEIISKSEEIIFPSLYNDIKYPELLRENALEGIVIAKVIINPDSKVLDVSIDKTFDNLADTVIIDALQSESIFLINLLKQKNRQAVYYFPFRFKLNLNH